VERGERDTEGATADNRPITQERACIYISVIHRKELEEKVERAEREAEKATADALKLRQEKLRAETRARELEEGKNTEIKQK